MEKIFVISASHNNIKHTKNFIKSFNNQTHKEKHLIFIDDGSTDNTSEFIKKSVKQSTTIRGDGSLWWTGSMVLGVNKALKMAKEEDYILTINSDCTFDKDYLSKIISFGKNHKNSIIGSVAYDPITNKPADSGVMIDWKKYNFIPTINKLKNKTFHRVDALTTKGTLFPIEVLKKIGNFDKKHFPHYLSDYEISIRAKNGNYELLVDHNSKVYSDPNNTGFQVSRKIKPNQVKNLLFSKKSKVNIIDHIQFINICAPNNYKLYSYLGLFKKIIVKAF